MDVAYVYDGTLEGLFTAVFMAFKRKETPAIIAPEGSLQMALGQEVVVITTDKALSDRVEKGIRQKMGNTVYEDIWLAFLSENVDKATKIYRYICAGLKMGAAVHDHLSHEDVIAISHMNRHTGNEAHLLVGFVRFSLMENGVFYAKITPKNNVLPLLMPHFTDRFSDQPFLIFDETNHLAGVYDLQDWYLVETEAIALPDIAEGEEEWKRLWKRFYSAIAIKERVNRKLRTSHMPKRYWQNMTETLI